MRWTSRGRLFLKGWGGGDDTARPLDKASSTPPSPPSGPMTRSRAKAIHDKVNSFLSTCDFGLPLNGLLPHADTLCILRYNPQEDTLRRQAAKPTHGEDEDGAAKLALAVLPMTPPILPANPGRASLASTRTHLCTTGSTAGVQPVLPPTIGSTGTTTGLQIGRASCRERV